MLGDLQTLNPLQSLRSQDQRTTEVEDLLAQEKDKLEGAATVRSPEKRRKEEAKRRISQVVAQLQAFCAQTCL